MEYIWIVRNELIYFTMYDFIVECRMVTFLLYYFMNKVEFQNWR